MRHGNQRFKQQFPEEHVRAYAEPFFAQGHDTVVLGHFHTEKELTVASGNATRRILVLPLWTDEHRHLEFDSDGRHSFINR